MPGAYTHISIARLLTSGNVLNGMKMPEAREALMLYPEFCHMGAISPDYPYLRIMDGTAEIWANAMHHKYVTSTEKNILHVGINHIKKLTGDNQSKCLAWFMGYVSHITADVTCHPVTNLLVGDYEADNEVAHRESELHQDVYIFKTRLDGDVTKSEHIKNVIGSCEDPNDRRKVDPGVANFWNSLLAETFPQIHDKHTVNINEWHDAVQFYLDNVAEEISVIPSRHIRGLLTGGGIAYPRFDEIDSTRFIDKLKTPDGIKTYAQVFDFAKENVIKVWKLISDGIYGRDDSFQEKIKIWNLDSGQLVKTAKVMWEVEI
ncbi:MAG: zinc dependent phospholipase C family protein [Desulfocapsaceae bacterium]|nr:zinc dependent phospholipase C family protein [Desulfocapsaceae bacterium]